MAQVLPPASSCRPRGRSELPDTRPRLKAPRPGKPAYIPPGQDRIEKKAKVRTVKASPYATGGSSAARQRRPLTTWRTKRRKKTTTLAEKPTTSENLQKKRHFEIYHKKPNFIKLISNQKKSQNQFTTFMSQWNFLTHMTVLS